MPSTSGSHPSYSVPSTHSSLPPARSSPSVSRAGRRR
jgi:hypothetical protein